tara:strand:+ start:19201 stop:20244 length:1044 start_codon:yes stop_codon:yes gene_type:complete
MNLNQQGIFKDKVLLITGGTGSFGNAVVQNFIHSGLSEIRIYSRDEKKQDDMRRKFNNDKLSFWIGDIRDKSQLNNALKGVNFVFHAAALKQVPSCEFHPIEAVKTNIIGTENLLDCCISNNIEKVICLSTDKAVYPINTMGLTKAVMEKICISKSRQGNNTIIATTRFGNVMASRGSVIPLFCKQISEGSSLTVTNPKMTRFMMYLDEAVELVFYAFENAKPGDLFVQKSPASTIDNLAKAMLDIFNLSTKNIEIIGTRNGEKLFEVLISREEMHYALDSGNYYKISPNFDRKKYIDYIDRGNSELSRNIEYTSDNTKQLSISEVKDLLINLPIIKSLIKGKLNEV